MKSWLSKNYYLLMTFVLVSALGWQTVADLTSADREEAFQSVGASGFEGGGRAPASLSAQAMALSTESVLEWNCKHKDTASDVASNLVRLRISGCDAKDVKRIIDIKNESNGSTATVFALTGARFETDLIALSPGNNKISLIYLNAKSRRVTESFDIRHVRPSTHD